MNERASSDSEDEHLPKLYDSLRERVIGCILGLALGDALGAAHEGGFLERAVWRIIGRCKGRRRWTDDTQMSINVIESLIDRECVDQDDLASRFARSYRWSRGYGPGAARVLKRIRRGEHWEAAARAVFRDGSYGNGGAMRSPAIGLYFVTAPDHERTAAAKLCASVTHAHPLGQEGAVLIAQATALAIQGFTTTEVVDRLSHTAGATQFGDRLDIVAKWLKTGDIRSPTMVAKELGNEISATKSCPTAVYVALAFRDRSFDELMQFVIQLRGDVDTIAAMAGAIWGASRGVNALPHRQLREIEAFERLNELAASFADAIRERATADDSQSKT